MSPKARFQVMLEPAQLETMRAIEARIGVPVSRQIRQAVDRWLADHEESKTERKRVATRKRP